MSRFFANRSDSDTSDSEESFTSSSDQESIQQEEQPKNRWLVGQADSDSDDDSKKVMKSAKAKRYDDMRACCSNISDAILEKDWVSISNEFEKLQKLLTKAAVLISQEGVPRFYIRTLCQVDDVVQKQLADKEAIKKLASSASKALNILTQKMKKETKIRENDMAKFRENPVDELESADEQEDMDVDEVTTPIKEEAPKSTISTANLFERLDQILEARGKKNTDKQAQIETLVELKKVAKTPYQKVIVLLALIPARFDFSNVSASMSTDMWLHAMEEIKSLYDLLDSHPHILFGGDNFDEETDIVKDRRISAGETVYVRGNVTSFADRLDDEFFKSLQNIDPHSSEYADRLRDEHALYAILVRAYKYSQSHNESADVLNTMLLRRIEHLYFKPDTIIQTLEKSDLKGGDLVVKLCKELANSNLDRIKVRASLCSVYSLALRDQYQQARSVFLSSGIQDRIGQYDIPTQTLYNRTLVQIGLSAFRSGLFRDCHSTLQEISSSGKIKELLSQGGPSQKFEKTVEQDKTKQLPFHMHIDLELVECAYLVSAMLLEIPNIAINSFDSRRKMISKHFRRMLEYSERQVFCGPPENTREHIMAGAKAMANGDWKKAIEYIHSIKVWATLPNAEKVKEMLASAIQEESLRTYVFTYASNYQSFGISNLGQMFGLQDNRVTMIVSKMIYFDQLPARIEPSEQMVIVDQESKFSRLEYLTNQYADKLSLLVESNEKLYEAKVGVDEKKKSKKR